MKRALLLVLFLAIVGLVLAALPPNPNGGPPHEQHANDGKKKKAKQLGDAFAPPSAVMSSDSIDTLPTLDAQTVAVAAQDAGTIARDAANLATNPDAVIAATAPPSDAPPAAPSGESDSMSSDQAAAQAVAQSASLNQDRAMSNARARKSPKSAQSERRDEAKAQAPKAQATAQTKQQSSALGFLRPGLLTVISGTKAALKEFPMVMRGDVSGYSKKVAKNAAIGACYGAIFRVAMEKFPWAKQAFVFGNIAYKSGSVCLARGWYRCIDATLTQLAKFGAITVMGGVLSPMSQKYRGVTGFVGSAVVFGVGSFAIDFVFDAVEAWFDDSPPLSPHKIEL